MFILAAPAFAQPVENVSLHEADLRVVQARIAFGDFKDLLVEINPNDLRGAADRHGGDAEAAGIAAQVEDAFASAEFREQFAVVALVNKEAGLVPGARRGMELHAVLVDHRGRRR